MYSTANILATELKNGRRELLTALLFGYTGAKFEGGEEGVCGAILLL